MNLKVQSVILIQHAFCHIQRIALHATLAVCSVCALKKQVVAPWETKWLRPGHKLFPPIYTLLQEHGMEDYYLIGC